MLKRKTDFVPAVLCCVSRDDKRRGLIVVTKQRRRWERGAHTKRNKKEREKSNFVQVNNSPVSRARTAGQLNLDGPQQCLKIHVIGLGTTIIVNRIWNWQSFVFVFFGFCFDWQSFAQTPPKKKRKMWSNWLTQIGISLFAECPSATKAQIVFGQVRVVVAVFHRFIGVHFVRKRHKPVIIPANWIFF